MATAPRTVKDQDREIKYPTRDGRPMGETELHRKKMVNLIDTLEDHFAPDPNVYVSGNLLVFYEAATGGSMSLLMSSSCVACRSFPSVITT